MIYMHGRKKKTSDENVITEEEKLKTQQAFSALDRLLQLRRAKSVSTEALDLTTTVLMLNPELSTAWNYRRDLISGLFKDEDLKAFLLKELHMLEKVLQQTLKSYAVWSHRKWVVKYLGQITDEDFIRPELELCKKLFSFDARNFHCWNHRLWLVSHLSDRQSLDLQLSQELIMKDPGNYSAWHVRSTAVSALPNDELEKTRQAVYTEPSDQSVWQYRRFLQEEFPGSLEVAEDVEAIDELLLMEPDAKYALMEKARRREVSADDRRRIYERLMEIDPMRSGYYRLAF
jgi:geranylgeranyl transferase type-2 subunit alpha